MILMIDNYDSFVFNIIQYANELLDEEILVKRNDKITLSQIKQLNPTKIILSPGPKHPKDSGVCLDILNANLDIAILGVCLGHQALGYTNGAKIKKLKQPQHGKTSRIQVLKKDNLFEAMPEFFDVMRYHSLYVDEKTLPSCLQITAKSEDGIIMGLEHITKPIYGIQFHPESYFTQYGKQILQNFLYM